MLLRDRAGRGAPWLRSSTEMVKPNASCRSIRFCALRWERSENETDNWKRTGCATPTHQPSPCSQFRCCKPDHGGGGVHLHDLAAAVPCQHTQPLTEVEARDMGGQPLHHHLRGERGSLGKGGGGQETDSCTTHNYDSTRPPVSVPPSPSSPPHPPQTPPTSMSCVQRP